MHQNCVLYQNLGKWVSLWFLQVDTGSHMRQFLSIHYIYKQSKKTVFFLLQCDQRSCFFSKLLKKCTRHFVKYKYSLQKIARLFFDWNWKILMIIILILLKLHGNWNLKSRNSLKKLLKQPKTLTCYICCLVILNLNISLISNLNIFSFLVINLSRRNLTSIEVSLLSKVLKYVPTSKGISPYKRRTGSLL